MTRIREGNILWDFKTGWSAVKYDEWAFYRNQFLSCADCANKAVDILAISNSPTELWLIESKDYRRNTRSKTIPLPVEVARKVRDTLAGLVATAFNGVDEEQAFARRALTAKTIRVVLHLEQTAQPTKLFRRPFDPLDVQQKIQQLLKAIDRHARVMDTESPWAAWKATWKPV